MKRNNLRIVIDTNVLLSAFYFPKSKPTFVLNEVVKNHTLLISYETIQELFKVIFRKKFDKFTPPFRREEFIELISATAEEVIVREPIVACKDPKDDKFLEAAVAGNADIIITGDGKLLELHPFRGIEIMMAAEFLKKYS